MSKTEKLLTAFRNGNELTAKQIAARFGIANPRATVSNLRKLGATEGFDIYLNQRGKVSKYRMGTRRKAA